MLVRQTVNFPKSSKMLNAGLSTAFLLKKKVAEENDAGTGNLFADSDSEDGDAFIGESRHFKMEHFNQCTLKQNIGP